MNFTLVSTVFNESKRLNSTIDDLKNQTIQPSEIVITDAGSTDGTFELLLHWKKTSSIPIVILQKKPCNVAEGRNLAIKAAKYELIVSMDFGCRFHPDWLKSITVPFEDDKIEIVGGSYTVNENDQITISSKAAYIISKGYNTNVHVPGFIPSSRSIAYKKSVYEKIGGYNEWLTLAGDDTVFGLEAKAKGFTFHLVDKQFVFWERHKKAGAFIKESNRNGLGEGEARINLKVLLVNIFTLCLQASLLIMAVIILSNVTILRSLPVFSIILLILCVISLKSFYSCTKFWIKIKSKKYNLKVLLFSFYLLTQIRVAYITGWLKGFLFSSDEQKKEAANLKKRLYVK